jgi:adenine-specific DNA methylase
MKLWGGMCRPRLSYMRFQSNLSEGTLCESEDYLTKQIITHIGNERSLLSFIEKGVLLVQKKLNKINCACLMYSAVLESWRDILSVTRACCLPMIWKNTQIRLMIVIYPIKLRIKSDITLPFPAFSNFNCEVVVYNDDSNNLVKTAPEVDLVYVDPPYNQHPYGSNYFMFNLILENKYPETSSKVSSIPKTWNRSVYHKKQYTRKALSDLCSGIKAKYILIYFNSKGFIALEEMWDMLKNIEKFEVHFSFVGIYTCVIFALKNIFIYWKNKRIS